LSYLDAAIYPQYYFYSINPNPNVALFQHVLYEQQMINDKIIHKVKDGLLKLFELNPKKRKILIKSINLYYLFIQKQ
jgi:hypothetical protein